MKRGKERKMSIDDDADGISVLGFGVEASRDRICEPEVFER